jgi:predicted patatin/cPLA2 family phospholipase
MPVLRPALKPVLKPEPFEVPEVYITPDDARYRPAWQGASIVDCALVLEGGAMRGQFTAGVLDFLMDEGVMPRMAVGVSAGALNGFNYVAGSRGRSCYLNTKYCSDWRYLSMRSFVVTGDALGAKFAFETIPDELDPFDYDAYRASPLALYTVASDIERGEADYTALLEPDAQRDYLRASASMPLVSRIVEIDGKRLLDGGTCDSVPVGFARTLATKRQIVILTQDAGYVKKPEKVMPLIRKVYADFPRYITRMENRHIDYNRVYREVANLHESGELFAIRPPAPVTVASMEHDSRKLYELWSTGYEEARRNWPALRRWLEL